MIKDNNARSFIPIAEGYLKSGLVDEAIGVLKAGLQVYPKYLGARVSLGKAYLEKGLTKEALKEFEFVVKISPDNIYAHKKLISIYRNTGKIDEALKGCETLLLFNPKDKEIISLHEEILKEQEESSRPAEGDRILQQVRNETDLVPQHIEEKEEGVVEEFLTETMGDLFIAQGDIEKGLEIYRRLLERTPDNTSILEKIAVNLTKYQSGHAGHVLISVNEQRRETQIKLLQDFLEKVQKNKRQIWKTY